MSSLKNYYILQSSSIRHIGIFVAIALIVSGLIIFTPTAMAASEVPSIEWIKTFNDLQPLSIIQTLDGGYAIIGADWTSEAPTFIKIDSSGNLQ